MEPVCLPYADVRPQIHSGDLLLCSGSSVMSRMIQHSTGSSYSHVAFILRVEPLDRLVVLESVESMGIRACTLGSYVFDYNGTALPYPGRIYVGRHAHVDLRDEDLRHRFSRTALDLLGYPYGTKDIMDITMRIVGAKLGMGTRPTRNDKTFICSEFAALVYESIDVHIPFNRLHYIAPSDFANCPDVTVLWEIDLTSPTLLEP